jgi:UDP-glucuronate decarboxylase
MESGADFTGPVNLGNPNEISMLELAEKILALTDSRSKLAFETLPQDDPKQRQPDIALARSKLKLATWRGRSRTVCVRQ